MMPRRARVELSIRAHGPLLVGVPGHSAAGRSPLCALRMAQLW
jgi:hypothetical protein